MKRSAVVRVAVAALVINVACSPADCCRSAEQANYDSARSHALTEETAAFEYRKPLSQAWPQILAVAEEHGFPIAEPSPVEGRTLQSTFKAASVGEYRLLLHVTRIDAARWKLAVDKQYRSRENDGGQTLSIEDHKADPEIDAIAWKILQRVEPERAGEIEQRVKSKAERAGAAGRGCDRGCATCASFL